MALEEGLEEGRWKVDIVTCIGRGEIRLQRGYVVRVEEEVEVLWRH